MGGHPLENAGYDMTLLKISKYNGVELCWTS
jgi:hypothetical protein